MATMDVVIMDVPIKTKNTCCGIAWITLRSTSQQVLSIRLASTISLKEVPTLQRANVFKSKITFLQNW